MIIPIVISKSGESQTIGTAAVIPEGGDFSVTFYLSPGFSLSDQARIDIVSQIKKLAREQRDHSMKNLSIG